MNKVGICFSTKDRTHLSEQSIKPLLQPTLYDLFIVDGSQTDEGKHWPWLAHKGQSPTRIVENICGGADAAIVHNLTMLLERGEEYTHVGLVENDVLLADPDWFARTMALFDLGLADGLVVGAASARCYADRILVQRKGYALMHNLGAGMVIYSRHAARLILDNYRTGWTTDNRAVFSQLSNIDIGRYWAFKGGEHWLTADWHFDTILASHGLASVALTPSPVAMIGQNPPIEEQGLEIVTEEIDEFRNPDAFETYRGRSALIRMEDWRPQLTPHYRDTQGELIFVHQFRDIGANPGYNPDWSLRWSQGFGPFAWRAEEAGASMSIPVFGPCSVLVTGGEAQTRFKLVDEHSGFEINPPLQPGIFMAASAPSGLSYRTLRLTALDPGLLVHGIQCVRPQPGCLRQFDWSVLPKVPHA